MVFRKAVQNAEASADVKARVSTLIDRITFSTFNYINRGLFERDKLTFTAHLTFQVAHVPMALEKILHRCGRWFKGEGRCSLLRCHAFL